MKINFLLSGIAVLLAGHTLFAADPTPPPTPLLTRSEPELIRVLGSSTEIKDIADACRELAVIGSKAAVPALTRLLADEKYNHAARYALETIPDRSVESALREQLPNLQGRALIGVLGSLGVRRDSKAVPLMVRFLNHADPEVVQATARALGSIATTDAVRALQAVLPTVTAANRPAVCEGLLRSAERWAAGGKLKRAITVYQALALQPEVASQVRAAAVRGEIMARGAAAGPLIQQSLRGSDYEVFAIAVRSVLEIRKPEITRVLADALLQLTADRQLVAIPALGRLGDDCAVAVLLPLTKTGDTALRTAAIRAAASTGKPAVVPALVQLLGDGKREIVDVAQDGLAGITDPAAAAAVVQLFQRPEAAMRVQAAELAGRRRMQSTMPMLFKAASDPVAEVRVAALKPLGELAGTADLPRLLDLMFDHGTARELELFGKAISSVSLRSGDAAAATAAILPALSRAPLAPKVELVTVLGTIGGKSALEAVWQALSDSHPAVHAAALRALADWPDASVMPVLQQFISTTKDAEDRAVAFGGFVRATRESTLSNAEKLTAMKSAATLATQVEQKRLVLAGMGDIPTLDSFQAVVSYLGEPDLAEDASASAVRIAAKLNRAVAAEVVPGLQRVLQVAKTESVLEKARTRVQQLSASAEQKVK